jgi:hypothetical protein
MQNIPGWENDRFFEFAGGLGVFIVRRFSVKSTGKRRAGCICVLTILQKQIE